MSHIVDIHRLTAEYFPLYRKNREEEQENKRTKKFWVEKDEVLSFMSHKHRVFDDVSRGKTRERVKAFGVKFTARPQHIKDLFRQVFP